MARIRSLQPGIQNVVVHPTAVDCFFQVVAAPDGSTILHLSTFGSEDRASRPKSSQSLQIDEEIASQMVAVLRATFPLLE